MAAPIVYDSVKKKKQYYKKLCMGLHRDALIYIFLTYSTRDVKEAQKLIADGAILDSQNYRNSTPLHSAASEGHKDVVKLLIGKGANLDSRNNFGSTPLHLAAFNGHKDVVKLLIGKGANLDSRNNFKSHRIVTKLLIDGGANTGIKDNADRVPFKYAAQN
ncbi:serine/threonine-protein phosphatase 6 regulatory ankyrin repeat subunit A-like, partial [Sitodiplosis mosellana]|uniref:serine/threonine-protein phosphatase 6 regulatory ankyrin repeat subunit A-like n=1 Tax=Sitodiplosis mosellana TaxID=263140 RepID=UPI0024443F3A